MDSNRRRLLAGSPSSSEAVGSQQNTPETKLTAFSPEELRSEHRAVKTGLARSNIPPAFALNLYSRPNSSHEAGSSSVHASSDPFIGPSSTIGGGLSSSLSSTDLPRLSPVATSFTPYGHQNLSFPASAVKHRDETHESRAATPRPNGTLSRLPSQGTSSSVAIEAIQTAVPQAHQANQSLIAVFPKYGEFSTDHETSRYISIKRIANTTPLSEIQAIFNKGEFPSMKHLGVNGLTIDGTVYASFSDIRDSLTAYSKAKSIHGEWVLDCIGTARYFNDNYPNTELPYLVYEAEVFVKASYGGPASHFDVNSIGVIVKEVLENYGDVMGMETAEVAALSATYRAEYYDTAAVDNALAALQGFRIAGCTLTITDYKANKESKTPKTIKNQGPLIIGQEEPGRTDLETAFSNVSVNDQQPIVSRQPFISQQPMMTQQQPQVAHQPLLYPQMWAPTMVSPYYWPQLSNRSFSNHRELQRTHMPSPLNLQKSGYSAPESTETSPYSPFFSPYVDYGVQSPLWSPYTPGAIGQERGGSMLSPYSGIHPYQQRSPAKYLGRSPQDYSSGHHNVVDIERIRQGLDVRTTIMLRNIPNKIDQAMLKDIVDETSRGKYDFMYLRIDFANNCNVGYAFINFEDPYYIIDFMNARAGHRWNRFNSDKVAEVSYATIQGRDCLVQKFRNSSVMLEHPSFRPKIFHTGTGPMSGTEDSFPGPDNPSKMRRSVENAEHVGLFAPRAGQNFRDEQRRRRSQYDRGTRLAEMEDALDLDHHEYRSDVSTFYPPPTLRYRRSSSYLPVFGEY